MRQIVVLYPSVFSRFFLLLVPVMVCCLLVVPFASWADGPPQLEKPKGEACLRSNAWMRRNHMDFLKHKRVMTVREGVRVRSENFKSCTRCHTSREKFCDQCHAYVGVAPNCFECHHYPK